MSADPNEDLATAMVIHLAGMLVPLAVASAFEDLLSLYLTGGQFAAIAAVAFGLVAWLLVEEGDLDRPNFLVASIVAPLVAFVALAGFAVVVESRPPAFRYLFSDGGIFRYPGLFVAAGIGAVGLSKKYRTAAARDDRLPSARGAVFGVGLAVVLVAAVVAGVNLAAASSTAIATVEPGEKPVGDPVLNVSVEGPPTELRVTAIAPDGTSVTERLSRAETRGGTGTVSIGMWFDDTPPPRHLPVQSGTYRVRMTSLAGVPVDTATFVAGTGAAASIEDVEATRGNLSRDRQPPQVADAGANRTAIGVVVENEGEFLTPVDVALAVAGDERAPRTLFLSPGERGRVAFVLAPKTVDAARADGDGTVTVRLYLAGRDDPASTATVELPSA